MESRFVQVGPPVTSLVILLPLVAAVATDAVAEVVFAAAQ